MSALVVLAALAAATLQPLTASQGMSADVKDRLKAAEAVFDKEAAAKQIGSMTVGIVDHGQLIWTKTYGFADMEGRVPASRRTLYRIGSITKQFTGFTLLTQNEKENLSITQPASALVPELNTVPGFGSVGPSITLLSLATHRSGLERDPEDKQFERGAFEQWETSLAGALTSVRVEFKPNQEANYSNVGYSVLGLAMERSTKRPYTSLVESDLLSPLGMTSTSFKPSRQSLGRLARGYEIGPNGFSSSTADKELAEGRGYRVPNGGLFTTVDDLAKFMAFEMGYAPERVLEHVRISENFSHSYPMSGGGRYGIGFIKEDHGSKTLLGHTGGVAGYSARAFFDPASELGIICLGSAQNQCQSSFLDAFAALVPAWRPEAEKAGEARAAISKRFSLQKPFPNGEEVLARIIGEIQQGKIDYSRMSDAMAVNTKQNLSSLTDEVVKRGELKGILFKGVGPGGADIYETDFASGRIEWRITVDGNGTLLSAGIRPLP